MTIRNDNADAVRQERDWYKYNLRLILNQVKDEKARIYARYALEEAPGKEA